MHKTRVCWGCMQRHKELPENLNRAFLFLVLFCFDHSDGSVVRLRFISDRASLQGAVVSTTAPRCSGQAMADLDLAFCSLQQMPFSFPSSGLLSWLLT